MKRKNSLIILLLIFSLPLPTCAQTVIATYQIHDHASGLAYDGRNIWYGRYGTYGERIYKFDTILEQIVDSLDLGTANLDDAYGLTWDGQYLWVTNHIGADFTLKFDTLGSIISSFQNPSDYMSGLAWNGSSLYMGDYYNPDGAIYKVTTSGVIIENFTAPDHQPWDLAWDGTYLWMCDYNSDLIYQIDPITHQVLFSFETPMTDPAGLTWDGNYLWVCDEGQGYSVDNLYKIAPFGGGTPQIQLSTNELDFGYVPLGSSVPQILGVSNLGDTALVLLGMPITPAGILFWVDPVVTFPLSISPGSSQNVEVYFAPQEFGAVSAELNVLSNDPINPGLTVGLEGYGIYPQQYVSLSSDAIDFGEVWLPQNGGEGMTGRAFEIYNLGLTPLSLISLTINDSVFSQTGFEPGVLSSMDTLLMTVYFAPVQAINYSAIMTLTTDDIYQPVIEIPLYGSGIDTVFAQGSIIWSYQVSEPSIFNGFNSVKFMDDVNGDGIHEVIAANDDYLTYCLNGQSDEFADQFYAFDTGWDPLRTGCVEYARGLVSAPDLNGDGCGDIVLGTCGGSRTVFAVSGDDGVQIWQFDTHNFGGEGGWVYEVTCEDDWNSDGIFDVLAGVGGPSGSADPKSVFLLDGTDGDIIWRAHLGETVFSVRRLDDVNYDGYDEVVCGTVSDAGNYFVKRLNGANGNVDWNHQVGYAVFSLNRINDLNGDNITDVVAAAGFTGVYALSGANGNEIWHSTGMGTNYYLETTDDLNANNFQDLLVTSVNGTFYALEGSNGNVIWSLPLGSNVLSLAVTPDVNGDDLSDACCGIMSGSFYAVSGADGSVLFSYTHGSGSDYAFDAVGWLPDIDNSGACEFLGGTRDGALYCFSGGTLSAPPVNIELNLEPQNPPIIIPPNGGQFRFNAQVLNTGTEPIVFDFWTRVLLPDSTFFGPILLRQDLNLPGGASISRTLAQYIPPGAPAGNYTYIGYGGDYVNNLIWAEDSFNFSKSAFSEGELNSGKR